MLCFGEPGVLASFPRFESVERVVGEFVLATTGYAVLCDQLGIAFEIGGEVGVGERFDVSVGWWSGGLLRLLTTGAGGECEEDGEPGFFHAGDYNCGFTGRRRR